MNSKEQNEKISEVRPISSIVSRKLPVLRSPQGFESTEAYETEEKIQTKLRKKLVQKYIEMINLPNLPKDRMKSIDVTSTYYRIHGNIKELLLNHPIDKTGMITAVFRATFDNTSAIYSMLYSIRNETGIKDLYLVHGGTFHSQDGEYRSRFIQFGKTYNFIEAKFASQMAVVEEYIVGLLGNGKLSLDTLFYFPASLGDEDRQKHMSHINESRFAIKFLTFCWLYDAPRIFEGLFENHIHPGYLFLMESLFDQGILDKVIQLFGGLDHYNQMLYWFSRKSTEKLDITHFHPFLETGQKLIPIKVGELFKTLDITYPIWKELLAMYAISDLVINLICPSFPVVNNWFIIQNSNVGLFDNYSMVLKHDYSKVASEIITGIDANRSKTFKNNNKVFGPINGNFYKLGKKLTKSMGFIDDKLRLAHTALGMHMEHVGKTFRHLFEYLQRNPMKCAEDPIITDIHIFKKHIFELIYASICIFEFAGIVHGDLHLNNATVYVQDQYYLNPGEWKVLGINSPHVLYYISEDIMYQFPHIGTYSMMLDFSRCLIYDIDSRIEDLGEALVIKFKKAQFSRVEQLLSQHFPAFLTQNKEQLEFASTHNHRALIKAMSPLDAYAFCQYLASGFDQIFSPRPEYKRKFDIPAEFKTFLIDITKSLETKVLKILTSVIKDKDYNENSFKLPTWEILDEFFSDYKLKSLSETSPDIVDVFNYTNKTKYHIDTPLNRGPLLDFKLESEIRQEFGQKIPPEQKQMFKKLEEGINEEALYSYQEAQKEELAYSDPYINYDVE